MRGLDWGRLYESYHSKSYDAAAINAEVDKLRADIAVKNKRGIYEFLLGGMSEPRLLHVRLFDEKTKIAAYEQQTQKATSVGVSNCPLCAVGGTPNQTRIYKLDDMDADHVTAWSKGGASDLENCQMLCVTHNRARGNR
jgi:5-methylcytosine-specific restriction endonuclease McrA